MKRHRKHWYKLIYHECMVCGRQQQWRERKYTKRPKDMRKRYEYAQVYDQCIF